MEKPELKLIKKLIFILLLLGLVVLFSLEILRSIYGFYFSLERLIYWSLFILWIYILWILKLKSAVNIRVGFIAFIVGVFFIAFQKGNVGEVCLRISLMGFVIGLTQEFFGRLSRNAKTS